MIFSRASQRKALILTSNGLFAHFYLGKSFRQSGMSEHPTLTLQLSFEVKKDEAALIVVAEAVKIQLKKSYQIYECLFDWWFYWSHILPVNRLCH